MTATKATTNYSKKYSGLVLVALALAGCTTAPPSVVVQRVNVAVPVECQEPVPARPVMPTDALRPGATVDDYVRAAMAEIPRREGYGGQLLAALEACRAPTNPSRPDAGTQGSTQ